MCIRDRVLTDAQCELISPLMPSSDGKQGKPFRDHRQVVEGIIYRYRTGIAWRDLPAEFGPWQTVWKRHRRLAGDGTWDPVSYTHLRAHETVLDLVCRLLLEKKQRTVQCDSREALSNSST